MNIEIIFVLIFNRHFVDFNAQKTFFNIFTGKKVININVRADSGQMTYLKHKVKTFL